VEKTWLPSKHIELTTRAAHHSNLDKHFFPFFGNRPMARILPSNVQEWVTMATAQGLAPRSVRKYHVMLHSIFQRAVRDGLILTNPCEHTEPPKVVLRRSRTLTPEEFDQLIQAVPERHRLMVETAIETGMRWGELIALRPRHIDFLRRLLTVEETIIEVPKRHSPTGERMIVKPYPKDNEARTFGVREQWLDAIANHISSSGLSRDDLLFATEARTPISRNTFRTRVWLPAVKASGLDFNVRMHDLRGSDPRSGPPSLSESHVDSPHSSGKTSVSPTPRRSARASPKKNRILRRTERSSSPAQWACEDIVSSAR
jgi:integrase